MRIENYNDPVAKNAARIIDERGLKRKNVARSAGYSEQMLSDMMNGRKIIRIADVTRLRNALGVSYNELFADYAREDTGEEEC